MRYISLYSLYVSMFQCFTETKCMPCAFCGVFMQYMVFAVVSYKGLICSFHIGPNPGFLERGFWNGGLFC